MKGAAFVVPEQLLYQPGGASGQQQQQHASSLVSGANAAVLKADMVQLDGVAGRRMLFLFARSLAHAKPTRRRASSSAAARAALTGTCDPDSASPPATAAATLPAPQDHQQQQQQQVAYVCDGIVDLVGVSVEPVPTIPSVVSPNGTAAEGAAANTAAAAPAGSQPPTAAAPLSPPNGTAQFVVTTTANAAVRMVITVANEAARDEWIRAIRDTVTKEGGEGRRLCFNRMAQAKALDAPPLTSRKSGTDLPSMVSSATLPKQPSSALSNDAIAPLTSLASSNSLSGNSMTYGRL